MKRLPNSELEIIMIIWEYNRPVTRMEIEEKLEKRDCVFFRQPFCV